MHKMKAPEYINLTVVRKNKYATVSFGRKRKRGNDYKVANLKIDSEIVSLVLEKAEK